MENSVLAKSMRTLTAITAGLKDLSLSSKFVIPDIVVAGSKCGGKSSTIEKLIGFEYLPRQYNTDTQRIQFHFIYTPGLTLPEAQIVEQINKGSIIRYVDFDKLRDHINKITVPHWNNSSPSNPIVINIYSSFMPNLTIIDLPGYSRIVINASYQSKLNQTRQMIENQIAKPGSLILGVFAANIDYLGCDILRMMRKCDPKGFRSLAAVPKVDIMDRGTNALSILKNEEIASRNGYVGIKNRSSQNRKSTSIEQALVEEEKFFKDSKYYKDLPRELWGTESLSLKLVEIIYEQTMKQLNNITQQLKQKKTDINTQIKHQLNVGIFFEPSEISGKRMGQLKAEIEQLQLFQKIINEDPFYAKVLNNHKQNPQDYNEIPQHLKPVELMRPRKNDFDSFFRPLVSTVPPIPPKPKIFANSEQRQADERKKKTFNRLFGL